MVGEGRERVWEVLEGDLGRKTEEKGRRNRSRKIRRRRNGREGTKQCEKW